MKIETEEQKHIYNKQAIKEILEFGEKVTVKSIWLVLKTTELRHYLSQLRKDGIVILSKWVSNGKSRFKEHWIECKVEVVND